MAYRLLGQRTGRKEGWHDVAVTISVQFWWREANGRRGFN